MHDSSNHVSAGHGSLELLDFLIAKRWRPFHPGRIQLYSFGTPNGVKIPIVLEELVAYEVHRVTLDDAGVKSPEFLSLNPNNKIPAIIDPEGPNNRPIGLFESGAILVYLADKVGKLFGSSKSQRYEILQWLMFQIGGVGPMFGQFGYFYAFGGKSIEDPRPRERYLDETKRLLKGINKRLEGRTWLVDDYSIADIAVDLGSSQLRVFTMRGKLRNMVVTRKLWNMSTDSRNAQPLSGDGPRYLPSSRRG